MSRDDAENKFVWCVFEFVSIPGDASDYDVLKGIYDSKGKAIARAEELEMLNKSRYKYFGIERLEIL